MEKTEKTLIQVKKAEPKDIRVRLQLVNSDKTPVRANVTVVFFDAVQIGGISVVLKGNELRINYPRKKITPTSKNPSGFISTAFPMGKEFSQRVMQEILSAYYNALSKQKEDFSLDVA